MRDVAKKANVSIATVSRVINGDGYASLESRRRVMHAADELGYKLDARARSLKLDRTNTVGLMIPDITNPFYSDLANGVLTCAKALGYHVILSATDEDAGIEREYLDLLMENRVDGILAVPTGKNIEQWGEAITLGTQIVLLDRKLTGLSDVDVVLVDNVKGAYEATKYLLDLGHQRIGILCGPLSTTTGKDRLAGYRRAHQDSERPIDDELIYIGTFKRESGYQGAQKLLSMINPPTAIFAANNVLGEATMFAAREQGKRIPDDFSLVLFDDVPWASLTNPQLCAVAQPTYTIGFVGMQRLAERLQVSSNEEAEARETILQPELIVRRSCAPPVRPRN